MKSHRELEDIERLLLVNNDDYGDYPNNKKETDCIRVFEPYAPTLALTFFIISTSTAISSAIVLALLKELSPPGYTLAGIAAVSGITSGLTFFCCTKKTEESKPLLPEVSSDSDVENNLKKNQY
jgi:hypothetical protein